MRYRNPYRNPYVVLALAREEAMAARAKQACEMAPIAPTEPKCTCRLPNEHQTGCPANRIDP